MLTALLIMRFLWFPLLIQYGGQLQVPVRSLPPVTLISFYGFNLTLHFMDGSKRVYSSSKSITGQINLQTVFELSSSSRVRSITNLGLLGLSFRPLLYNPYSAKIIETYCTGIRANCSGVKIYYNL